MPHRDYQAKLARDNAANLSRSRSDRDIAADYPPPGNQDNRVACERDFRRFCETYFPAAFTLAWSDDHLRVIARIQECVLNGGLFALAMPRGSGKTSLCERAALWALLYGHRRFVCLIGATEAAAENMLEHLKTELQFNELLAADFRQVCYPLRRLENNARKCVGQLFNGQQTRIDWSAKRLTLPTLPDDACDGVNVGGSTVTVAGLTGAIRGQSHTLTTGEIIRPELVILDDPQTRESATSPSQSAERAAIVNGDVLGMAGPGRKIAAVMPCTVIRADDMADRLLDRKKCPRWQGERCKMVYTMPSNDKLWDRYARMRAESFQRGGNGSEATAFYQDNREGMDAGAAVAWSARYNDDELSALQHAMNLRLDDEAAFAAEYQNEPIRIDQGDGPTLTTEQVAGKLNGLNRGMVPVDAEHLTAFVDVHDSLLFYAVVAWSANFDGWVIDYGSWPEQHRRYFTLRKAPRTLAMLSPGAGREGAIRAGLDALAGKLLGREWEREDGAPLRIERCLVDAGYVADLVHEFCRHSDHAAVLMPSRGIGIGAASKPIAEYNRKQGDRIGFNWYIPKPADRRVSRHFRFDTNFWKSFIVARLTAPLGDQGCLSLFGKVADEHRLIADHLVAEVPVRTVGHGRTVDEWRPKPDRPDNHWFDCLTGCAAAASLCGAVLPGSGAEKTAAPRQRVSFAEMQRNRRVWRSGVTL